MTIMIVIIPVCVLGGCGKATLYRDEIMIDLGPQCGKVTIYRVIVKEEAFCVFWLYQQRAPHVPLQLPCWQAERPQQVSWVQTLNLRGPSCRNCTKSK